MPPTILYCSSSDPMPIRAFSVADTATERAWLLREAARMEERHGPVRIVKDEHGLHLERPVRAGETFCHCGSCGAEWSVQTVALKQQVPPCPTCTRKGGHGVVDVRLRQDRGY